MSTIMDPHRHQNPMFLHVDASVPDGEWEGRGVIPMYEPEGVVYAANAGEVGARLADVLQRGLRKQQHCYGESVEGECELELEEYWVGAFAMCWKVEQTKAGQQEKDDVIYYRRHLACRYQLLPVASLFHVQDVGEPLAPVSRSP